ncbi:type VII secretion-associated protein [Mycolicibacterium agri]|uniref:Type VII secretion-associated protein n=1 Tax=Mycolicibacterium agri TaxID=36811 RepID=A0A7I9W3Q9_MYCAG|nr:type VII secretion-associated protein [Mycolicibacterium agri]GFG51977.1 type VII secretion-associated protein [Mycolicibacterium agri]
MTDCVVEVGPGVVRGPNDAPAELVSTALECIDDEIALLDDEPVAVAALWRELFRYVLRDGASSAVLVVPTWWPQPWIDRVRDAVNVGNPIVVQRSCVLSRDAPGIPIVVEIAPEFVAVSRDGRVIAAEPRLGASADIAAAVVERVGRAATVIIDAPFGIQDASGLATAIGERLRSEGVSVTIADPDRILTPPRETRQRVELPARRFRMAQAAGVVSVALACVGAGVVYGLNGSDEAPVPMTLLVEGRVGVKVPAQWKAQRITAGPGSARVQVSAPDGGAAVLMTQTQVRRGETLTATAAALRSALDDQPDGVFTDFNPDDRRAERPAATYIEAREGRRIDWAVFVDDTVRIAIGCQRGLDEEPGLRGICDEAIRSAHAIA